MRDGVLAQKCGFLVLATVAAGTVFYLWADTLPQEIRQALDQSASLPVEQASDLIFALADSGRVPADVSVQYLTRIYNRADEAQRKHQIDLAPARQAPDRGLGFSRLLSIAGFDASNIRIRALKRVGVHDPEAARRMLLTFSYDFPTDTGRDRLDFAVTGNSYYPTLLAIAPAEFESVVGRVSTPQQAASLLKALKDNKNLSTAQLGYAMGSISRALDVSVSSRVFAGTETTLQLGATVEAMVGESSPLPQVFRVGLAKAWLEYASRELRVELCSDGKTTSAGTAETAVVNRANRIADLLQLGRITPPSQFRYASGTYQPGTADPLDSATDSLYALAAKFKTSGSTDLRERLVSELTRYAGQDLDDPSLHLDRGTAIYRMFVQVVTVMEIAKQVDDNEMLRLAANSLILLLERPGFREADPVAWIVAARWTINLSKSPSAALSTAISQSLTNSRLQSLATYRFVDKVINLVPKYQTNTLQSPLAVMGTY